jgi:predicted DNA-binding transcriptional regulator YafY
MIAGYLWPVRASRLVGLMTLLQARGRMTARQLAGELEVSQRTIIRDIEALSSAGIPVYAIRGSGGGFELLGGSGRDLPAAGYRPGRARAGTGAQRARVRLSPRGRSLAALSGRPASIRIRRNSPPAPGREDWVEASVRIDSVSSAVLDMLALGAEVEVLHPAELRAHVGETARKLAELHRDDGAGVPPRQLPGRPAPAGLS